MFKLKGKSGRVYLLRKISTVRVDSDLMNDSFDGTSLVALYYEGHFPGPSKILYAIFTASSVDEIEKHIENIQKKIENEKPEYKEYVPNRIAYVTRTDEQVRFAYHDILAHEEYKNVIFNR